jgi:hypothetical protein
MATRNEYTSTVRDLQELLKREADQKRREDLGNDLKRMAEEVTKLRGETIDLRVLTERVDNLKTLTWVLIFALAATVFALVMELVKK